MAAGVVMPKAGITVESCIITQWYKKVGDKVAVGDLLFNYETAQGNLWTAESTAEGRFWKFTSKKGTRFPV